jgi:hypothetical protein
VLHKAILVAQLDMETLVELQVVILTLLVQAAAALVALVRLVIKPQVQVQVVLVVQVL